MFNMAWSSSGESATRARLFVYIGAPQEMVSIVTLRPEMVSRSTSSFTKMKYRSGERMASCLTPWWIWKLVEMAWFHVTEHEGCCTSSTGGARYAQAVQIQVAQNRSS